MRGVVSTSNENHSGSQPSVGTYLDEQPVTTIDGTVDVHVYDIARVEVLTGPQGTLYGASSEAGTIRIITNKPDPLKFDAGYNLGVNYHNQANGGTGYTAEGFVNVPLSTNAAVRLVGWYEHDAGFISNVAGNEPSAGIVNGVRTFNTWGGQTTPVSGAKPPYTIPTSPPAAIGAGAISNSSYLQKNYNTVDTYGARGALKVNLGDNWTVTPTVMGQEMRTDGFFGYDPAIGDLQLVHFGPENSQDAWVQAAMTIEGKINDFDLVYAGAFMKRTIHSIADYADYSFFYDNLFGSGSLWVGNKGLQIDPVTGVVSGGNPIMPQELVHTIGYFQKWSHELRLTTPQQYPVKATIGLFIQRQLHDIYEQYIMPGFGFSSPYVHNANGLADYLSIPTLYNTIWLTDEQRVDRDQAAFAQVTWDISQNWSATVGYRYFKFDNSLEGFYGYSNHYQDWAGFGPGMNGCFKPGGPVSGDPCTDLSKSVSDNGHVPLANLTYKFSPDALIYATYSKGFRPGGVNRNGDLPPYHPDYLVNYELGWKTQWFNRHLRWNGALFWEDWNDFQFSFLGPNSLTIITNAGDARIKGVESELEWAVGNGLILSWNATYLKSEILQNYCGFTDPNGNPVHDCPGMVQAPAGTRLPIAPKFKTNVVARYSFPFGGEWLGNLQAAYIYQTDATSDLRPAVNDIVGSLQSYGMLDLSGGVEKGNMNIQLFITNATDERAQFSRFVQSASALQPYIIPATPRTIGLKFGQKF